MRADLHCHSIYSDGKLGLEELVKHSRDRGIDVLALTDHDTVLGDDLIIEYGNKYGVKVIKGIELSCRFNGETIHIVGLFKNNIVPKEMVDLSNELEEKRKKRAIDMALGIRDIYNICIDIDKLISDNKIITRKNILDHILSNNDISLEEAKFYISKECKAYISSFKFDVKDGIDLLHKNNCICILAHPCLIKSKDVLDEVVKMPFDGIEARYANSKNNYELFLSIAKKYGLFISAGSDFHGDKSHGDIGDCYLDDKEVDLVLKVLNLYGN
ncbi:MAG: PHP domain-containing protein [Acholeplasmatales bacterium]|nr:PHP domain-containing protein [Acholeplasmatales bacterium]